MPRLPYVTLDVFTTDPLAAGNPLAVVTIPAGTSITKQQEHLIAREFNYSETTFIYPPGFTPSNATEPSTEAVPRIAIWTIDQELPFAGHPTVGTSWYLATVGAGQSSAAADGGFEVDILAGRLAVTKTEDGKMSCDTPHKVTRWEKKISHDRIRNVVTFPEGSGTEIFGDSSKDGIPVTSIVDGMTFALVEVANLAVLEKLKPGKKDGRLEMTEDLGAVVKPGERPFIGAYAYTILEEKPGTLVIRSRMFFDGDQEDPATGSAACALSSYLSLVRGGSQWEFEVTQGVEMGRKSDIGVKVVLGGAGEVKKVFLEGHAVKVMEGFLNI